MGSINLLEIFPPAIIDETIQSRQFNNLSDLYNLNYIVRFTILDLIKINKLKLYYGKVYAFGDGIDGQLGDDDVSDHYEAIPKLINSDYFNNGVNNENIIHISAGINHSLVLTKSGKVYAFGDGEFGRLGDGDISDHDEGIPKLINPRYFNDGENNEKIIHISAGTGHSLVLTESGKVYAFGNGYGGRLGDDDTSAHDEGIPQLINPDYFNDGENNENVIDISTGEAYSLVLTESGKVYAFGKGEYGVLGDGNISDHKEGIPQLINPEYFNDGMNNEKIIHISAGGYHSLVLT